MKKITLSVKELEELILDVEYLEKQVSPNRMVTTKKLMRLLEQTQC